MYDFTYLRPRTLDEAAALLRDVPDAKLMAGGLSLLPVMKQRLAKWGALVDLAEIGGLSGIAREGHDIVAGARAKHVDVASSALVHDEIPALSHLAEGIGDPLVRNRGTIGGSLANADPAADYPAAVLGLGASVVTDRRVISGDSFFLGLFETALEPGEIIIGVRFPIPRRAAYVKFKQPASRFAIAGAFVAQTDRGVRVAITGAGAHVFRIPVFERSLEARFAPDSIAGLHPDYPPLNGDIHASADYRAHVVGEIVRRAVTACLSSSADQTGAD